MHGGSEAANHALRAFMRPRSHRALTEPERAEYQRLLRAWSTAQERERVACGDIVEVA